jgi:hypothetical protein
MPDHCRGRRVRPVPFPRSPQAEHRPPHPATQRKRSCERHRWDHPRDHRRLTGHAASTDDARLDRLCRSGVREPLRRPLPRNHTQAAAAFFQHTTADTLGRGFGHRERAICTGEIHDDPSVEAGLGRETLNTLGTEETGVCGVECSWAPVRRLPSSGGNHGRSVG